MSVIDQALSAYFQKYPPVSQSVIGVAVSGGADSLCLAYHLITYARNNGLTLKAVTVDHCLRPESADEAHAVHEYLQKSGIEHTILTWKGKKPTTGIEEKARQKRYELMRTWCLENGIQDLFLAHHLGDQAETFWLRLSHTSGLDGLTCMEDRSFQNGIYLCRPFLNIPKSALEHDLRLHHKTWFEDAMNDDEAYERVRWRHRQKDLSKWGLSPEIIEKTVTRLTRARQALDFYTNRFLSALADISPKGYTSLQEQAFLSLPDEIRLRVIRQLLGIISPLKTPLSLEALEKWLTAYPKKATLAGCLLLRRQGLIFIAREAGRMPPPKAIPANCPTRWDRFTILASCPVHISGGCPDSDLPNAIRQSVPNITATQPIKVIFMTGTQKELEKKFAFDYKNGKQDIVIVLFEGTT